MPGREHLHEISNDSIKAAISSQGAELQSLAKDGFEYIWQGNVPGLWEGKAPLQFPFVGRHSGGVYLYEGKEYSIDIHGFAKDSAFEVVGKSDVSASFRLESNPELEKQYPFKFCLTIQYSLKDSRLYTDVALENTAISRDLHFGLGWHPGINVPLDEGLAFDDYYIEFEQYQDPQSVVFSESLLFDGLKSFALEGRKRLPLSHSMFDADAISLVGTGKAATLKSGKGSRYASIGFEDMKYFTFWHNPKTKAPFICIEPQLSFPGRQGIVENLNEHPSLQLLKAGNTYRNGWWIEVG